MVEKTLLNNIRPFKDAEGLQKLKNSAIRNCCIKMLGINIAIMPKVYNFIFSKVSSTTYLAIMLLPGSTYFFKIFDT